MKFNSVGNFFFFPLLEACRESSRQQESMLFVLPYIKMHACTRLPKCLFPPRKKVRERVSIHLRRCRSVVRRLSLSRLFFFFFLLALVYLRGKKQSTAFRPQRSRERLTAVCLVAFSRSLFSTQRKDGEERKRRRARQEGVKER